MSLACNIGSVWRYSETGAQLIEIDPQIFLRWSVRAISICFCLHALLRKSDPKAAIIWIVLMSALPWVGVPAYILLGINRFPGKLRSSVNHVMNCSVNNIKVIVGIESIHDDISKAIDGAHQSVVLSTYIFRSDDLGNQVADALESAHQRGVRVRILLDGFGNSALWGWGRARMYSRLHKAGLDVRLFNAEVWPWSLPYLNLRNHRKICVVDRRTAFIGSANIGRIPNLETQFTLSGDCAGQLEGIFDSDWGRSGSSARLSNDHPSLPLMNAAQCIDEPNRLVLSSPANPVEVLRLVLLDALLHAKSRIRILTPYFLPDEGLRSALLAARFKGVDVEILLPARSNYSVLDWASRRQSRALIKAGCTVAYRSDCFDHSKLMTIDENWALIGSSNWDARSFRLNQEVDLISRQTDFVVRLDQEIDRRFTKGRPATVETLEGRHPLAAIRNALARLALPYL